MQFNLFINYNSRLPVYWGLHQIEEAKATCVGDPQMLQYVMVFFYSDYHQHQH